MLHRTLGLIIAILVSLTVTAEPVKPGRKPSVELPQVWKEVKPNERLKALRVAELDAMRLLAERIYGMELTSGSMVYDFMLQDDTIKSDMQALVRGAQRLGEPEYTEEGIVYVAYGIKLRRVYETISKVLKQKGNTTVVEELEKKLETVDTMIETYGNGAAPGSRGLSMIRAKRAAEVDAFRKMAELIVGVRLSSKSTVRDFMLESDRIHASVAACLKGLKPIDITYDDDDVCEVTVQLTIRQIIEIIERTVKEEKNLFRTTREELVNISEEVREQEFKVTGTGAPRNEVPNAPASPAQASNADSIYTVEKTVLKRLVSTSIALD